MINWAREHNALTRQGGQPFSAPRSVYLAWSLFCLHKRILRLVERSGIVVVASLHTRVLESKRLLECQTRCPVRLPSLRHTRHGQNRAGSPSPLSGAVTMECRLRRKKAARQQYLTPREEEALENHALLAADNGYHLPVRALRSLAQVIARQHSSIFQ